MVKLNLICKDGRIIECHRKFTYKIDATQSGEVYKKQGYFDPRTKRKEFIIDMEVKDVFS